MPGATPHLLDSVALLILGDLRIIVLMLRLWQVSPQSPQTHFLKLPPLQWLGPSQQAFCHTFSPGLPSAGPSSVAASGEGSLGCTGGGLTARYAGCRVGQGALGCCVSAVGLCLCSISPSVGGFTRAQRSGLPQTAVSCRGSEAQRGKPAALSHAAAKLSWTWSPVITAW